MVDLFDFDPGGLRVKAAIAHFKAYLQRRYPDRSTGKHYISDLTIFSQFVGKTSPRDITVKTIDAFVQAQQAAKLLGHNDLQTTQLYIDGAAPTVRQDFERAMQGLVGQPAAALAPSALPAAAPAPHERPDHKVVLEQVSHLIAALPAWLAQAVQPYMRRRMARWSDHRLQPAG